jgi:hypothetical protein
MKVVFSTRVPQDLLDVSGCATGWQTGLEYRESDYDQTTVCDRGDALHISRVMPLVYDELKRLARHYMARERAGQTFRQPRLSTKHIFDCEGQSAILAERAHFCAIAAHAMREILVKGAVVGVQTWGSRVRISFENAVVASEAASIDILALHESLDRLLQLDPQLARIVELGSSEG